LGKGAEMMPWEKYQAKPKDGPWNRYKAQPPEPVQEETGFTPRDTGGFFSTAASDIPSPSDITIQDVKRGTSALARPVLEASGTIAGGMLGTGAGAGAINPMTFVGSGLGYSIGSNTADRLDELMGLREPMPLSEIVNKSVDDVYTGASYEVGGQIIGKALPPVVSAVKKGGKWVLEKVNAQALLKNITNPAAQREAAAILAENRTDGAIFVKNMEEANELMAEIPGLKLSLGQKTNDPGIIKLERVQMRSPGTSAGMVKDIEANNVESLRKYYSNKFGGPESIDDVQRLLSTERDLLTDTAKVMRSKASTKIKTAEQVEPQTTGKNIIEQVKKAEIPVKRTMGELEKAIPEYPMEFTNLKKKILEVKSNRKISADQRKAVEAVEKDVIGILKRAKSTYSAMGARRTLNNAIDKHFASGADDSAVAILDIKNALEQDISELTRRARSGEIGEYRGRAVNPNKLAIQLEKDSTRLAELSAQSKPDIQAMQKELSDTGYPTMQVTMEGDKAYAARLQRDYKNKIGKEVPYTSDNAQNKMIAELKDRVAKNKEILSGVSPGQDVAASMRAYNEFAHTKYFNRFDTPSIRQAGAKGVRKETIPSYFNTPSGADDLINAIGKDNAAGIMKGHYAYKMMQDATDPTTGQVVGKKLASWYSKNKVVLKKYGIDGYFNDLKASTQTAESAQTAVKDFERSAAARLLNANPEDAIKNAIKGNNSGKVAKDLIEQIGDNPAAQKGLRRAFTDHIISEAETTAKTIKNDPKTSVASFRRLVKKYRSATRELFKNEPQKIKAVENMQKAYEYMARNASDPIGGGPETAGILLTAMNKATSAVTNLSRTAKTIEFVVSLFKKLGVSRTNKIINNILFDPDSALAMKKIIYGTVPDNQIEVVINNKILKLSDYRIKKLGTAATAAGIMVKNGNNN
jgi:hypothetical protein